MCPKLGHIAPLWALSENGVLGDAPPNKWDFAVKIPYLLGRQHQRCWQGKLRRTVSTLHGLASASGLFRGAFLPSHR